MAIRQSRGITLGKGTPQRLEGQNGDITIRSSRKGLKLYVKESNKWHSINLGIDLLSVVSSINRLEKDVKRLSNKTNNAPVVDKLLLRQSGGTSAVGIQNKSGLIAFRNSTDTADGKVQSIPFDIGTDNTSGKGWGQIYYNSETNTKSHYIESRGLVLSGNLNNPDDVSHSKLFLINRKSDSAIVMFRGSQSRYIMGYDNVKSTTFTDSTCDTSSGDATVTMDDVSALVVGSTVSGTGIPANATINSVDSSSNTFELSANATANGTNVTLTFQTADERFKIHNGAAFADDSIFNLDANGTYIMGNVGIGTTSPTSELHISTSSPYPSLLLESTGSSANIMRFTTTDGTFTVGQDYDDNFSIANAANITSGRVFTILKSNGNVGIGTTSPDDALDIGTSGSDARIFFSGNAGGGGSGILYKDSGGSARYALHFEDDDKVILSNRASNGTVQIRANTSTAGASGEQTIATFEDDKVGIGTTSPTTTLDVEGTVSYKHTAFSTAGPTDGIDVSDTTVLEVDTSSNNVVIGGFSGGVQGQILHIVKTDTANLIQLEHNETPAAGSHQKIFLTSGSDERVVGYGGYTLYCNGASWFSLSNPTGAADAG
jgi:hypothetical protein